MCLYLDLMFFLDANIWYVSEEGADDNDCHSESTPCRNLRTVMDRAKDGADIYLVSDTITLVSYNLEPHQDYILAHWTLKSNISYRLISLIDGPVKFICRGRYFLFWQTHIPFLVDCVNMYFR